MLERQGAARPQAAEAATQAPPLEERVRALLMAGETRGAAGLAIEALGPPTLRYLRSLLHEEDDAAETFSQWAENVWRGLPAFRFDASLRTWSFRLAWHAALNLRHQAWQRHGERLAAGQASLLAESIRSRSEAVLEHRRRILADLRSTLDDQDRSLLLLRLDQELTWEEVSQVLAWEGRAAEPATLMKRYQRLKTKLGRLARERGLLDDPR